MRRIFLALAPLALLAGCNFPVPLDGPKTTADQTIVDEKVALGVETMYQGWVAFVESGVDLGLIKGDLAARLQDYDRRIYGAVVVARQAYDAGNATNYATAAAQVSKLMAEGMALVKGN